METNAKKNFKFEIKRAYNSKKNLTRKIELTKPKRK